MDVEQFYSVFWGEYVSKYVVPTDMMINNQEFFDELNYEMYQTHKMTGISLNQLARITESFIKNMIIYKPKC